ncbi:MAG: hypothetical protein IPP52_11855 [Ignavibacteria bacterium]|nr:hypothetical protein [Ignavibacteria bacterium]
MTFNWAGGILSGGSTYKLKIVQITGNQSPVIAFETNRAFFEKEDLRIPSFQYRFGQVFNGAFSFSPGTIILYLIILLTCLILAGNTSRQK